MGHHQLDSLDEQILKLIASNARIPFLEVARVCGVSGAAIHQRIQKLTDLGVLKGSEFVLYPDAPHAFHADYRASFREAAARDGWQRLLQWLRTHGV